jgi:hypothetical protein
MMSRSHVWTIAFAAIVAFAGTTPAAAPAEEGGNPIILPEPTSTSPLRFTSTTEAVVKLENASTGLLECTSGTTSGEFTSKRLGVVTMTFKGCAWKGMKCETQGAELGTIIFANAGAHLVAFKLAETLRLGMVIKLAGSLPVTCWLGAEFRGSVIALIDGPASSEKTKTLTLLFHKTLSKQELKECELDKEFCFEGATHRKFLLEAFNGLAFVELGLERSDKVTLEKEASFVF